MDSLDFESRRAINQVWCHPNILSKSDGSILARRASPIVAGGEAKRNPRNKMPSRPRPGRGGRDFTTNSARRIPRRHGAVVFHGATAQKIEVLLLEGLLPMMFLLPRDIIAHIPALRRADCECSIAILPGCRMLANFLVRPSRGCSLYVPNDVRQAMCGSQADEQMNVIVRSANGLGDSIDLISLPPLPGRAYAARNRGFRCAPPPANFWQALQASEHAPTYPLKTARSPN